MNSHNLSKRLGDVRELAQLSQTDLAKRLGVSPSLVSHWESGTRVPSQLQLMELARAFGVALDYLLNAEVSARFQFRAKATLKTEQRQQVERVLKDASEQVYFIDVVLRAAGKNLKPFGLKADFSYDQLTNLAAQFREALRLNRRVTLGELKEALAEWNVFVFEWAMPVCISGMSYRGSTTVIFINALHTRERKLFTLAHEFAHVLFHLGRDSKEALGRDSKDTMVSVIASNRDPVEKEANQFASELLMASAEIDGIVKDWGNAALRQRVVLGMAARTFNVSVDAMFYRLAGRGVFRWEEKKKYIPGPPKEETVPEFRVNKPEEQVSKEFLHTAISLHEREKASAGKVAEWLFAPRIKVEGYLADLGREQENGIGGGEDE
jgi:Zn-dependent peptidase ImmA (M78 family)/DNA-binding XRE family transcriptional regulator